MATKADRDLNKLNDQFRKKVVEWLKHVGDMIFITEAWRSSQRQKEMIAKGLSKVNHSNHQDGEAVDIAFKGDTLYPPFEDKRRRRIADSAKSFGIDWGGDLWKAQGFTDLPHFQDNGKALFIEKIIMGFYEEIYKQENPNGGNIIKDPDGAMTKIVDKDGNINIPELIYFMCIGFERLGKK